MTTRPTPAERTDIGRLGREAFEQHVRPHLRPEDDGKFIAIDVDTGEYEIDASDYAATMRIHARRSGARVWLMRAGHRAAHRIRRAGERMP